MCFAPQRRALFPHRNLQKWSEPLVFCTFWLGNVLRATTACTFSTTQLPKVVRTPGALYILTWKCASRHNGVHFFDIATVHFDLEMCFAPQRRALFRHRNFQKWSDAEVFCTFWLRNVLRATTACTFSTSQLPKVDRTCCVLYILTWKCASSHNGVQFFISPLASWLRTRRFSEPTFRPSRATNHFIVNSWRFINSECCLRANLVDLQEEDEGGDLIWGCHELESSSHWLPGAAKELVWLGSCRWPVVWFKCFSQLASIFGVGPAARTPAPSSDHCLTTVSGSNNAPKLGCLCKTSR